MSPTTPASRCTPRGPLARPPRRFDAGGSAPGRLRRQQDPPGPRQAGGRRRGQRGRAELERGARRQGVRHPLGGRDGRRDGIPQCHQGHHGDILRPHRAHELPHLSLSGVRQGQGRRGSRQRHRHGGARPGADIGGVDGRRHRRRHPQDLFRRGSDSGRLPCLRRDFARPADRPAPERVLLPRRGFAVHPRGHPRQPHQLLPGHPDERAADRFRRADRDQLDLRRQRVRAA